MFVLQEQSSLEDTVNKGDLRGRVGIRGLSARYRTPQLEAEIEMMTSAAEQTVLSKGIAERTLADTGRTQKKNGVDGK
jgi:hypothetical protein